MSRQVLFCVESNSKARTDYQYIESTIKRFYIDVYIQDNILKIPVYESHLTKLIEKRILKTIQ